MTFPPSWPPERRAQLAGVVEGDPRNLPPEAQVLWDLAQDVFVPGSTWMWGNKDRRVFLGVVEKLSVYSQGDGHGLRIGAWMGGKYAVPIWPHSPASLQPARGRGWSTGKTTDSLYYSIGRLPAAEVPADVLAAARSTFVRGREWVWGAELSGRGSPMQVEVFRAEFGSRRPQIGVRMIEDFVLPVWPAAPANLQPDPSDDFIPGYEWQAEAIRARRNPPSKQARRFWAQAEAKRRKTFAARTSRAHDSVTRESVDLLKPVAYHVTLFENLPRIRAEGLKRDSFLTTEAGIPMWITWLRHRYGDSARPAVLRVDTRGLRLLLDGEGTYDAIDHVAARVRGGREGVVLRQVVAGQVPLGVSLDRITWQRPESRQYGSRSPLGTEPRYEIMLPGKWKKNPSYPWLDIDTIRAWVPRMSRLGVSEVARSPRGFLTAYAEVGGDPDSLPPQWHARRAAFIKRHMAQVDQRDEPLYKDGQPTRRHLALVAWAFSPDVGFTQRKVSR